MFASNLHQVKFSFQKSSSGVNGGARTDTGRYREHENVCPGSAARLLKILPASLVASISFGTVHIGIDTVDVRGERQKRD